MSEAENNLASQLLAWAVREAEREAATGCYLLRTIQSSTAHKYVRFIATLSDDERNTAVSALVRRMNEPMLLRRAATLEPHETNYVDRYLAFEAGISESSDNALAAAIESRGNRRTLRAELEKRFGVAFGAPHAVSPGEWFYESRVADIRIRTHLDIGGRLPLTYYHVISMQSSDNVGRLSALQWVGASSATHWDILPPGDFAAAAECAFCLSRHFISQMEGLFQ